MGFLASLRLSALVNPATVLGQAVGIADERDEMGIDRENGLTSSCEAADVRSDIEATRQDVSDVPDGVAVHRKHREPAHDGVHDARILPRDRPHRGLPVVHSGEVLR